MGGGGFGSLGRKGGGAAMVWGVRWGFGSMRVILAVTSSWARDKRWLKCVLVVVVKIRGLRFFRGVRIALCESMDSFAQVCFEIYPFFVLSRSAPLF